MTPDLQAFLERCSPAERPAFEAVIEALDELVTDGQGADDSRPMLAWAQSDVSLMLQLRIPQPPGKPPKFPPVLYIWPSDADRRKKLWDSISMSRQDLIDARVAPDVIDRFGKRLEVADLVNDGTIGWRTRTFRDDRLDRMSSIFGNAWGPKTLAKLKEAVQGLVNDVAA